VEKGESFEQALVREMREELGIQVDEATPLTVRYYTASNGERQRIHYFHIKAWTGKIVSNEAESVFWESDPKNLSDAEERKIVARLLNRPSG
jgi:8-oxo-dGTP diphosphatase